MRHFPRLVWEFRHHSNPHVNHLSIHFWLRSTPSTNYNRRGNVNKEESPGGSNNISVVINSDVRCVSSHIHTPGPPSPQNIDLKNEKFLFDFDSNMTLFWYLWLCKNLFIQIKQKKKLKQTIFNTCKKWVIIIILIIIIIITNHFWLPFHPCRGPGIDQTSRKRRRQGSCWLAGNFRHSRNSFLYLHTHTDSVCFVCFFFFSYGIDQPLFSILLFQ